MRLSAAHEGARTRLLLEGRLDGEWAQHLSWTLEDLMRGGTRQVVLDMAGVDYVSTPGVSVLAQRARDFAAIRGELLVVTPSPAAAAALALAGLEDRIVAASGPAGTAPRITSELLRRQHFTQEWRAAPGAARAICEAVPRASGAELACRIIGDPARLADGTVTADECEEVALPANSFAVGVGAIAAPNAFERMGELVAAAGSVAYLPTGGALVPDYMAGLMPAPPRALLASGLVCTGAFSQLVRFTASGDDGAPLGEIADAALRATGGSAAGIVIAAESVGLVGASLRRTPGGAGAPEWEVPEVRDWLTLTAEPSFANTTVLAAGVVARHAPDELARHLRPLGDGEELLGHFHAAVFSYRPVPQRTVPLEEIAEALFGRRRLRAVLHLLADRREHGAGESAFRRGLAWAAPITRVEHDA